MSDAALLLISFCFVFVFIVLTDIPYLCVVDSKSRFCCLHGLLKGMYVYGACRRMLPLSFAASGCQSLSLFTCIRASPCAGIREVRVLTVLR